MTASGYALGVNEGVDIREYLDTDLIASEDLAVDPAFWLNHLLLTMGDLPDDAAIYGVSAEALEEMSSRMSDSDAPWPVFRVPFDGGHTALVVYANYEDENNIEFVVRHPDWGRLGHLGNYGPEGAGPGLAWAELTAIAASVPQNASPADGLVDPAQRLLLLLPMLGDAATPAQAWGVVAEALAHCGIPQDAAARLAKELLGDSVDAFQMKPSWTFTDGSPLLICSSQYSPRQIPLALGITPEQAQALAAALTPTTGTAPETRPRQP